MSKIALEGNALGSGTFTIASPNSNTSRTLSLPDATGTVVVTGTTPTLNGITFPATQVASADPNTLDDYEEGTFTPTALGQTSQGTTTYNIQTGTYVKIGRQVTLCMNLDISAMTGTGNIRIGNFPFANNATQPAVAVIMVDAFNWTQGTYIVGYITLSETSMRIFSCGDNISWAAEQVVNESQSYVVNLTYFV